MKRQIKNNVYWLGKIDWQLKKFHGDEYTTEKGSSYNSFLIQEEKNVLIDTVWMPFDKEFVENLKKEIDLKKIDFIVANHGEIDHSGSLPELMRLIPDTPIYCTANGVKSMKGHYHQDWNFKPVKTGDRVSIGNGKELMFIEATMLHWPDTMMTYLTGDNILFSNDVFGHHLASENMFNDLVDNAELFSEAMKYYANIITPFSAIVDKKLNELAGLNLSIDMICPSHGVIWRDNPSQIVAKYGQWCKEYKENQITVLYDTMWEGTRRLAETIAKGIKLVDPDVTVKLFYLPHTDKTVTMKEVFRSKAIMVGSPTLNRGYMTSVAATLEEMRGLGFKGKKAAAFGCYGWSGESVKMIEEGLTKAGFEITEPGIREFWNPDQTALNNALEFGKRFAEKCK